MAKEAATEAINYAAALKTLFIALSAAIAVALTGWATAFAQARVGAAGAGAMAEKPELGGIVFIMVAIPETTVVLGFVVALMIVMMLPKA